jgi:hypothetical protein
MWDPVVRVGAAVESRCVRTRGLVGTVDEASKGRVAGARLTHGVDSDVIENGGKLCCGERSKRATQADRSC